MRVTGGTMRGRALVSPDDQRIRPTSDKVRQAVFNVLRHNDFGVDFSLEGVRAIDLFAGTGALGIEAVSQGATFSLFVEEAAESRALIRRNVETLGLTGTTKIWRRDATDLGPMSAGASGPFGLAFLDPPYRKGLLAPALASLRDGGWLIPQAVLVAESAADDDDAIADGFTALDDRMYGDTKIRFLRVTSPQ